MSTNLEEEREEGDESLDWELHFEFGCVIERGDRRILSLIWSRTENLDMYLKRVNKLDLELCMKDAKGFRKERDIQQ